MSKQYIVVMLECADGNANVGTQWIESTIFDCNATLAQIMEWQESIIRLKKYSSLGRLMLSRSYVQIPNK